MAALPYRYLLSPFRLSDLAGATIFDNLTQPGSVHPAPIRDGHSLLSHRQWPSTRGNGVRLPDRPSRELGSFFRLTSLV